MAFDGSSHETTDERFKDAQRKRTTNEKLISKQPKWSDTKPRDFKDRDERIRRINARRKGTLLKKVAKNRKLQRIGKIATKGKGSLLTKVAAKGIFRLILWAGFWVWVVQITLFILSMLALVILFTPLIEIVVPGLFLDAIKTSLKILSIDEKTFTYALVGILASNPLTAPILIPFGIEDLVKDSGIVQGMFYILYATAIIIGWLALVLIWFMYKVAPVSIHPLDGKRLTMKWLLLVLVLLMNLLPLLPWFLTWAWYISKHPE